MTKKQIASFVIATLIYWGYMYGAGYIGGRLYGWILVKIMK